MATKEDGIPVLGIAAITNVEETPDGNVRVEGEVTGFGTTEEAAEEAARESLSALDEIMSSGSQTRRDSGKSSFGFATIDRTGPKASQWPDAPKDTFQAPAPTRKLSD